MTRVGPDDLGPHENSRENWFREFRPQEERGARRMMSEFRADLHQETSEHVAPFNAPFFAGVMPDIYG